MFPEELEHLTCRWLQNATESSYDDRQFQLHLRRKMRLVEQRLLATLFQSKLFPKQQHVAHLHQGRTANSTNSSSSDSDSDSDDITFVPRSILRHRSRKFRSVPSISTSCQQRQKHVHFADSVGQQLECVQHIVRSELPPVVPVSALDHLRKQRLRVHRQLHPLFQLQDRTLPERVQRLGVALEDVQAVDTTVQGVVRVRNDAYEKQIVVRYTLNEWQSYTDVAANYIDGSHDGQTDKFSFSIFVSSADEESFVPGCKLHFAIKYVADGKMWWDNNDGTNYTFECHATSVPVTLNQSWVHFS